MPKRRSTSSTCAAASADIYRGARLIRSFTGLRQTCEIWRAGLHLDKRAASDKKNDTPQRIGVDFLPELFRSRQDIGRVVRQTLR